MGCCLFEEEPRSLDRSPRALAGPEGSHSFCSRHRAQCGSHRYTDAGPSPSTAAAADRTDRSADARYNGQPEKDVLQGKCIYFFKFLQIVFCILLYCMFRTNLVVHQVTTFHLFVAL